MSGRLFPRLAATNIRKNKRAYLPYIITSIVTTAMFYIMLSLSLNEALGDTTYTFLRFGTYIVGVFAFIFLFYTNSFLTKSRKKEFGLYNILGMEKKHIARVMFFETVYVLGISLVGGICLGMLLDRLMFGIVVKLIGIEVKVEFHIYPEALQMTILLFAVIFGVIFLNSLRMIHLSDPIRLLKGGNMGEREPKAKWLLAILGAASLGSGYYIALSVDNPVKAIYRFFIAVLLVIIGTYLIFEAGSIALLKLLKKNKDYYYKTSHFISVSGMMYRMKQNAVGLANICILSTMVLVTISSTLSLSMGVEDCISTMYPHQLSVGNFGAPETLSDIAELEAKVKGMADALGMKINYMNTFHHCEFTVFIDGDTLERRENHAFEKYDTDILRTVVVTPLEDYNRVSGSNVELGENEVLLWTPDGAYNYDTIKIFGMTYDIKNRTDDYIEMGYYNNLCDTLGFVVKDMDTFNSFYEGQSEVYGASSSSAVIDCWFDLDCGMEGQNEFMEYFFRHVNDDEGEGAQRHHYSFNFRAEQREFLRSFAGTFLFLGLFLGLLFTAAAVLIIYYKQISEGMEDRARFEIMQNVGMSHSEVKSSINSQVLTVFFMPLILAGIHTAVAFPIVTKLIMILGFNNKTLFMWCTAGTFLAFAVIYGIVYFMTAKVYYRIVRDKEKPAYS